MVMLGVTGLQVLCSVGAIYFGSRTGMGFGRDLRRAMFEHVTTFSERETARFGAPTLLTRSTNDVRQIQYLVQMTGTVLVTAPIMCIGGIVMAIHQEAALTWLLLVSVPILARGQLLDHVAHAAAVSQHAEPDRRHQSGDARPAVRRPGGPGVHARSALNATGSLAPMPRCRIPRWPRATGKR